MSDLFCNRCTRFTMYPPCNCVAYKIKRLEKGYEEEEPEEMWGHDPEQVAERWAEEYDQNDDYDILHGDDKEVEVIAPDGSAVQYVLTGETVAQYHAHEKRKSAASRRQDEQS